MERPTILVFARHPTHDRPKTRLRGVVGDAGADALHRAFLGDTLDAVRLVGARTVLSLTAGPRVDEDAWVDVSLRQEGGDFGARFDGAVRAAQTDAYLGPPFLVLGADTPHLGPGRIRALLALCRSRGSIVGGSPRGGFYVLGSTSRLPAVASVFREADEVAALERIWAGRMLARAPDFYDVDTPQELERLRRELFAGAADEWVPARTLDVMRALAVARHFPAPPSHRVGPAGPG